MTNRDHLPLAKPFDRVFGTEEHALAIRPIVAALLEECGILGPHDPRLSTTVFRDKLHVNVGNWLVASLLSDEHGPSEIGLLFRQDHGLADWRASRPFSNDAEEPPVVLAYLPYQDLANTLDERMGDLLGALERAAQVANRRFRTWSGSPYRRAHVPWMAMGYYDEELLARLVQEGLPDQETARLHVVPSQRSWTADAQTRSLRLALGQDLDGASEVKIARAIRRGDVLVQIDGQDAQSVGLVMHASRPGDGVPGRDAETGGSALFDVSVRGFPTDVQALPPHLLPTPDPVATELSLTDSPQSAYTAPDTLASRLLARIVESAPEDVRDLVAWAKQGIEARVEVEDPSRRPLPSGPITDRLRRGAVRVVKVAPGRGGALWQDFLDAGIAAVGWDDVGDLRAFPDFDTFRSSFAALYPHGGNVPAAAKKAREAWTLRELEPGDLVVANRGISEVLGIGEVIEPGYVWREDRGEYRHTVRVRWDERYRAKIQPQKYWAVVTVLDLEPDSLIQLLEADEEGGTEPPMQRVRLLKVPSSRVSLREFVGEGAVGDRLSLPVGDQDGNADLQRGDVLVLWQSGEDSGLHGVGKAMSSPEGDPDAPDGSRSVDVQITDVLAEPVSSQDVVEDHTLSGLEVLQAPSRSVFVVDAPEWAALQALLSGGGEGVEGLQPKYDVQDVAEATGLPASMLERWVRAIHRKGQAILYGPPGTGKTYVAKELAKHLVAEGDGVVQVLQFHAATAYEDFMQGLRPEIDASGNLSYVLAPGGLLKFVREARGHRGVSVLILDEINRADLARVFGELMYLLEYRDETVSLAAGGKKLSVPRNIRLLGTMNTADRSVALVDHALRRRFAFLRLQPDLDLLRAWHRGKSGEDLANGLADELAGLHRRIDDPHLALGISYFLVEDLPMHLPDIWRMEIEPYLEELFFDEADPLGEFAWDAVAARLGYS